MMGMLYLNEYVTVYFENANTLSSSYRPQLNKMFSNINLKRSIGVIFRRKNCLF